MNPSFELLPSLDLPLRVALLLVAAVAFAELGQRALRLPRVSGYIVAGVVLGPGVLGWVPASTSGELRPLMLLGLGLLLFELGSRVDPKWLAANPRLLLTSLSEAGLTFVGVYVFMDWIGSDVATAVTVAAIAVSTSPTVVMRIVSENRARGQMTQRLLLLTALNSLLAIVLAKIGLALIHLDQRQDVAQAIAQPLYLACGSFLFAVAVAVAAHFGQALGLRRESERFAVTIATLLVAATLADRLELSVPLVLLAAGMLLRARSPRLLLFPEHFGSAGALLVIVVFVLTGVAISPADVLAGGLASAGLLVIRAGAKCAGAWWSAGPGGLPPAKAAWLGVALLPMSGLAVLLAYDAAGLYPAFGERVMSTVLGAVAVMELVGPILTQLALRRAGEADPKPLARG